MNSCRRDAMPRVSMPRVSMPRISAIPPRDAKHHVSTSYPPALAPIVLCDVAPLRPLRLLRLLRYFSPQ